MLIVRQSAGITASSMTNAMTTLVACRPSCTSLSYEMLRHTSKGDLRKLQVASKSVRAR